MKKYWTPIIILFLWSLCIQSINAGDVDTIKQRIYDNYLASISYSSASSYLSSQNLDGSWSDIDYTDVEVASWQPLTHLTRLKSMAAAYANPASSYYQSSTMLDAVSLGIDYWYYVEPESDNWWYNDIGKQLEMAPILFLLESNLTSSPCGVIIGSIDLADDFRQCPPFLKGPKQEVIND